MSVRNEPTIFSESRVFASCFCPISEELMTDPVIDQCGHTFDRKSLEQTAKKMEHTVVAKFFIPCPIAGISEEVEKIRKTDKEKAKKGEAPRTVALKGEIDLRNLVPNLAIAAIIDSIQRLDNSTQMNITLKILFQMNKNEKELSDIKDVLQDNRKRLEIRDRQTTNILTRSFCDSLFSSSESIMNKNISDAELEFLKTLPKTFKETPRDDEKQSSIKDQQETIK